MTDWSKFQPIDDEQDSVDWASFTPVEASTPTTFESKLTPPEAAPVQAKSKGVIGTVSDFFFPPAQQSVMEGYTLTPEQQEAERKQRLALGVGPVNVETVRQAQDVREGTAPAPSRDVKRVAQALDQKAAPTVTGEAQRLTERERAEKKAEQDRQRQISRNRKEFAEANPNISSFAAGGAGLTKGIINAPSAVADAFNETFINPILSAAGFEPIGRTPTALGTEYLGRGAQDFMPAVGSQEMGEAWNKDQFAPWLMSKLSANSPQIAMQVAAAFVPPLRAAVLPTLGASATGGSFAEGDDSRVALAKGSIEVLSEMLPLKAFDKVGDALRAMPVAKQNAILALAGQRILKAGGAVTANGVVNAIEETVAQFGGNVLDKYFEGKDVALTDKLGEAAVIGAATGKVMSAPQAYGAITGQTEPNNQIGRALEDAVEGSRFTQSGVDAATSEFAGRRVNDPNLVVPPGGVVSDRAAPTPPAAALDMSQVWQDFMATRQDAPPNSNMFQAWSEYKAARQAEAKQAADAQPAAPVEPTLSGDPIADVYQARKDGRIDPSMGDPVADIAQRATKGRLEPTLSDDPVADIAQGAAKGRLEPVLTNEQVNQQLFDRTGRVEPNTRLSEAELAAFYSDRADPTALLNEEERAAFNDGRAPSTKLLNEQERQQWFDAFGVPAPRRPLTQAERAAFNTKTVAIEDNVGARFDAMRDGRIEPLMTPGLINDQIINPPNLDIRTEPTFTSFTPEDSITAAVGLPPILVPTPLGTQTQTGDINVGTQDVPATGPGAGSEVSSDLLESGVGTAGSVTDIAGGGVPVDAGSVGAVAGQAGPVADPASEPVAGVDVRERASDSDLLSRIAQAQGENNNANMSVDMGQPVTIWTGRSGDGYATQEAAEAGLESRLKRDPDLNWEIEQMPSGKFRLAGYEPADAVTATAEATVAATPQDVATATEPTAEAITEVTPVASDATETAQAEAPAPILAPDGKPFSTEKVATVYAQANGIADSTIVPSGSGWAIQTKETTNVDEAAQAVQTEAQGQQQAASTAVVTAPSGQPFSTKQVAGVYAKQQGITGATIVQSGNGWVIQPQETSNVVTPAQTQQAETQGQEAPVASTKQLDDFLRSQAPLSDSDVASLGSNPQSSLLRNDAQQALNNWARSTNETAPQLGTPDADAETTVNVLGNLFGEATGIGPRVVAFNEPNGINGLTIRGTAFVNTAPDTDVAAPRTTLHEIKHVVEGIAAADTRAGRTNTPAQQFTAKIDGIFDEMTDTGKRAYAENFLHKDELDRISDPVQRETRLQELLAAPTLRSEMTADFLGNRATDRAFLIDLAKTDPKGFEGFVQKWLSVIDNLIAKLRGSKTQGGKESAKVDQYVRDLSKAKMVARDALVQFRKGNLGETEVQIQDQMEAAPFMSKRETVGDFDVRTMKDGTTLVYGDADAIRAQIPDDVKGRVTKDGIMFTTSAAPRVKAALGGRTTAYSREGAVLDKLPIKDGKYVGAPEKFNTPGKIPTLRKLLRQLADEGAPGRYWYENSGKEVLKMVGGDMQEARKFVALLAIYSPQAKVDANSTFALRAWAQYKAGQPISVKTGSQDRKATEAMQDVDAFWKGEKTGNFFFNLLREIDPSTAGKQGATIDMWMMRAGQYENDAPTATQYGFMENETNRLAAELGWEPQQVQAAIWVAMKARMENKGVKKMTEASSEKKGWIKFVPGKDGKGKVRVILNEQKHRDNWLKYSFEHDVTKDDTKQAKFDFGDGLKRHIGQVSFEARPGRTTGVLPGIHSAPYAQQVEFQQAVQKAFLNEQGNDQLAMYLGLLVDNDILVPGVWQGEISPSTQLGIAMAPAKGEEGKTTVDPAQAKALNVYAAISGLVARQEGVGWHRPFYASTKRDANGLDINVGRPLNPREVADLETAVGQWMADNGNAEWQDQIAFVSSPEGIRIVNFGIITNEILQSDIVKVAESALPDFEYRVFASSGDMPTNNWKENPNGESYVQRIGAAGRSDVLDWARTVLAPRVQSVFNEYSDKYGWGEPGELRFSKRDRAGRDEGRSIAPLAGAPIVEGATGPDSRIVEVAEQYARDNDIDLRRQAEYVQVDPVRARRIANAYEVMPHAPQDQKVKEAYENLARQTMAQYRALESAGYKFYFFDETNDPYNGNPWNAMRELRNDQVMGVFATEAGFGSTEAEADNVMLEDTGIKWPYGSIDGEPKRVLANDLFRAVHDAFGHGLEGAGFRERGEENAWQAHVRLFTGSAVGAITSETRGQNSWLNYGPNGEQNRTAKVEDTVFADQKTGLMPEWTWSEGRLDDMPAFSKRQPIVGEKFTLPMQPMRQTVRIKLQDDALRMRRVIEAVKKQGGTVGEAQNFYDANTLMPGRIQSAVNDFRNDVVLPMIDKAVAADIELDELSLYAYAKHAPERNAYIASINKRFPDGGSGMTNADAAKIIADVAASGKQAEYDDLHQDLMAITSTTRQMMVNEGLITQDEFDAMDGAYENYVPLRGLENVDEDTGAMRPGVGRGINVRGNETIRALGRRSRASDLIENALRDYQRAVQRVEKNDVGKVLLDFVLSNPDSDLWDVDVEKTNAGFDKTRGVVQYTKVVEKGEDTIGLKVGGKQVYIKLADPDLARALRQAWKDEVSGFERVTVAASGWFNSWMRNVLTRYNPLFAAINIARDSLWSGSTAALSELGFKGTGKYIANYGKALMASGRSEAGASGTTSLFGNPVMDRYFKEFQSAGGITGGFYMKSLDDINADLRADMLRAGAKSTGIREALKSNLWNQTPGMARALKAVGVSNVKANQVASYLSASGTAKALEFIGSASENATRFALYMAARESGKTPVQAALLAKNGTTNFNRKGEFGGALNNLFLFFNAGMQGTQQLGKVLQSKKVQAVMMGVAGTAMMAAFYGAAVGGDDEDGEAYWDKLPDYEKERNLIIMLPPGDALGTGMERVGQRGRYMKIPVQYGFNFFPNLGYMAADVIRNQQDPRRGKTPAKAAMHMTSTVFGSINPFGGSVDLTDGVQVLMAVMPTIVDLPVQLVNERSGFGTPSGPERSAFDPKPDSERMYTSQQNTVPSKIAKVLNELGGGNEGKAGSIMGVETSVTPGTIKTLISATTGGLGNFVEKMVTSGMAIGGQDKDLKASNMPFVSAFYGEVDEGANIRKAGDRMREVGKAVAQIEEQVKLGIEPEIGNEEVKMLALADAQETYQKAMTQLRKDEIAIIKSDLTEPEKKLIRQQLQVARDQLATGINRVYLDVLKMDREGAFKPE